MIASTIHELDLSQLQDQITQLAKNLKSEKDLGNLAQQLVKCSVFGDPGCFQKMDNAYTELEACNEPFYDRIW